MIRLRTVAVAVVFVASCLCGAEANILLSAAGRQTILEAQAGINPTNELRPVGLPFVHVDHMDAFSNGSGSIAAGVSIDYDFTVERFNLDFAHFSKGTGGANAEGIIQFRPLIDVPYRIVGEYVGPDTFGLRIVVILSNLDAPGAPPLFSSEYRVINGLTEVVVGEPHQLFVPIVGDPSGMLSANNNYALFYIFTYSSGMGNGSGHLSIVFPEPASVVLFGVGVLALCRRQARGR